MVKRGQSLRISINLKTRDREFKRLGERITKPEERGVMIVPKKYWCRECNQEVYLEEELISAGGCFRDGEPYCPKGHKIDVYGDERLAEEFAMMFSVPVS